MRPDSLTEMLEELDLPLVDQKATRQTVSVGTRRSWDVTLMYFRTLVRRGQCATYCYSK